MLAIEMLPGGHGDALLVEWGNVNYPKRMLVDVGTVHSYTDVRTRLLETGDSRYETFVITHVDEDHIGGAVSLLDDRDLRHRVKHIWFNGYVHCRQGGSVLGPVDGERLTKLIRDGSYRWNESFTWPAEADVAEAMAASVGGPVVVPSDGELPRVELAGEAVIHLLSPTGPKLALMADVWEDVVKRNHLVPGAGTDRLPTTPKPYRKPVKDIGETLTLLELEALATMSTDPSEANGSSIAFILEVPSGDKDMPFLALFGADAHAPVLARSLKRFARQTGQAKVRLDLFKLSHHGSRANISRSLMALLDVDTFLLSSNGDNFGHPNDAAIACAILGSTGPATFHCNYRNERTLPWVKRGASVGATFVLPDEGAQGLRVVLGAGE
jgi:hypothetical protein